MINVLEINGGTLPDILTQHVEPPRGHHCKGQESCPTHVKNIVSLRIRYDAIVAGNVADG